MAAAAEAPLTGVALAATPDAAPAGWTVITGTVEGAAANLGKGFGHKGGGYLCVSSGGAQALPGPVVTDVLVLSERSPQPAGYSRVPEFPEPRTGGSRKKRLYVKLQPVDAAETAVLELRLSSRSKVLPLHEKIGELGHFALWCRKGPVPKPDPDPQSLGAGLRQLSLHPPDSHPPRAAAAPGGSRHTSGPESLYDASGLYGLSAMDGVPFTLHPRFESSLGAGPTPLLADLRVKSLADIEKEYDYGFVVERTAAARLPPGVC